MSAARSGASRAHRQSVLRQVTPLAPADLLVPRSLLHPIEPCCCPGAPPKLRRAAHRPPPLLSGAPPAPSRWSRSAWPPRSSCCSPARLPGAWGQAGGSARAWYRSNSPRPRLLSKWPACPPWPRPPASPPSQGRGAVCEGCADGWGRPQPGPDTRRGGPARTGPARAGTGERGPPVPCYPPQLRLPRLLPRSLMPQGRHRCVCAPWGAVGRGRGGRGHLNLNLAPLRSGARCMQLAPRSPSRPPVTRTPTQSPRLGAATRAPRAPPTRPAGVASPRST